MIRLYRKTGLTVILIYCAASVFVCAVVASRNAASDSQRARKLGRASVGIAITGLVVSVIAATVVVVASQITICHQYRYAGDCYDFKTYVGTSGSCYDGVKSSGGFCYAKYCSHYAYRRSCYRYKMNIGPFGTCSGVKSGYYCYYASCQYIYGNSCYKYKTYVGSSGLCYDGAKVSDEVCYSNSCLHYAYAESCYKYKRYVGSFGACSGVMSDDFYCYFN